MWTARALGVLAMSALAFSLGVGGADADRRATDKERRAIAKAVGFPTKCAKVRISTETRRPRWASASWRPGPEKCEPFASDGVTVLKRKNGRWRVVTAGSDFHCGQLYRDVPRRVAKDLDLPCH